MDLRQFNAIAPHTNSFLSIVLFLELRVFDMIMIWHNLTDNVCNIRSKSNTGEMVRDVVIN